MALAAILSCYTSTHATGTVTERRSLKDHDLDFLESRDVIGHVIIRLSVVDFIWVVHSDHASI